MKSATPMMDENTRRYYLDAMGVQCWQLIDSPQALDEQSDKQMPAGVDGEVTAVSAVDLEKTIQACTDCVLHKTRKQALSGRGNLSAELMFVMLSPTTDDDKNSEICSGEENVLFSKMLAAINIKINDVYISALLKCSVPMNHTISPEEIQSCHQHLKQQIQFIRPKVIVVLGETAARCLLQKELSIDDSRAMNESMAQQLLSVPLFFSYSPEELLQQAENKRKAWTDLQQLQKIIEKSN